MGSVSGSVYGVSFGASIQFLGSEQTVGSVSDPISVLGWPHFVASTGGPKVIWDFGFGATRRERLASPMHDTKLFFAVVTFRDYLVCISFHHGSLCRPSCWHQQNSSLLLCWIHHCTTHEHGIPFLFRQCSQDTFMLIGEAMLNRPSIEIESVSFTDCYLPHEAFTNFKPLRTYIHSYMHTYIHIHTYIHTYILFNKGLNKRLRKGLHNGPHKGLHKELHKGLHKELHKGLQTRWRWCWWWWLWQWWSVMLVKACTTKGHPFAGRLLGEQCERVSFLCIMWMLRTSGRCFTPNLTLEPVTLVEIHNLGMRYSWCPWASASGIEALDIRCTPAQAFKCNDGGSHAEPLWLTVPAFQTWGMSIIFRLEFNIP